MPYIFISAINQPGGFGDLGRSPQPASPVGSNPLTISPRQMISFIQGGLSEGKRPEGLPPQLQKRGGTPRLFGLVVFSYFLGNFVGKYR